MKIILVFLINRNTELKLFKRFYKDEKKAI